MIRRLTPDVIKKYDDIIAEQRRRDFIEEVNEDDTSIGHYLPHIAVKRDSATTPIRIVYDCSCSQGASFPSLNDCLQTGPSLINDLPSILLQFRSNNIALTSDIEKAFLNVRLEEDERKFTKFLWLLDASDPEGKFITLQFKTVLFGAVCSPFILNAVIKTHLDANNTLSTAKILKNNIYVDNVIDGVDTTENAIKYYKEANKLMTTSGFKLRAWSSNCEQLNELSKRDNLNEPAETVSVLGMRWSTKSDKLTYPKVNNVPLLTDLITKRDVVSFTSALYDPIGYLTPVHVKARLFIQLLWKLELGWDEPLNSDLCSMWMHIAEDLNGARSLFE
ncbi:uncharacterized protein LOC102804080, partial [Saccoglossus kowalevskii]|uniref:Uncharacterized protein LOC102804080 n=1 Tax=Saccoglossus kowalevskii TaxID=10224 RepID=A0ABM0M2K3_SACKO